MVFQALTIPTDYPKPVDNLQKKDDLIVRAQKGELVAFRELVDEYSPQVYSITYQMTGNSADAKDIAQEIFIKLYLALNKFNNKYRFTTWLYRMAVNASIDFKRKQLHRREFPLEEMEKMSSIDNGHNNPEFLHERNELKGIISRLTGILTERQRKVFILRDLQSFSTSEVARILNCSQITVRVHLASARVRIKKELQQKYPELDARTPLRKGGYK